MRVEQTLSVSKLLAAILLLASYGVRLSRQADEPGKLDALLHSDHFKVTAIVRTTSRDAFDIDNEVRVAEFLSNELERARLEIERHRPGAQGAEDPLAEIKRTYFYSSDARTLPRVSSDKPGECELSNGVALIDDLFGIHSADVWHEADKWLSNNAATPKQALGPSKLLYLVQRHRNKLVAKRLGLSVSIRNQPAGEWKTNLDAQNGRAGGEPYILRVYFRHDQPPDPPTAEVVHGLPMRVALRTPDGEELMVDYRAIEPVDLRSGFHSFSGDDNVLSLFNYPLGIGCSRFLSTKDAPWMSHRGVASFEAEISGEPFRNRIIRSSRIFVALDTYARVLRLDRIHHFWNSYTITIEDNLARQRYHVAATRQAGIDGDQSRLLSKEKHQGLLGELHSSQRDCFAARAPVKFYDEVLPYHKLVLMGHSYVRGTKVTVLEQVDAQLPRLFFQQATYLDAKGEPTTATELKVEGLEERQDRENRYSIVYYLALETDISDEAPSNQEGQGSQEAGLAGPTYRLLRVDVLETGSLLYRAEVFNFRWALAEAPNSDKPDQLFALALKCPDLISHRSFEAEKASSPLTPKPPRRSANMMLLELVCRELPRRTSGQISRRISSPTTRHEAIIRALSQQRNSIFATQVVKIDSRLEWTGEASGDLRILASLELVHSTGFVEPQFEAVSVGHGLRRFTRLPTKARDFDECFWEAASALAFALKDPARAAALEGGGQPTVLFSFCHQNCLIDGAASRKPLSGGRSKPNWPFKTDLFFYFAEPKSGHCEVLEMRVGEANQPLVVEGDQMVQSWFNVYTALNERRLKLKFDLMDSDYDLEFEVERIQLSSLAGSSALISESLLNDDADDANLLDGLAFEADERAGSGTIDLEKATTGERNGSLELPPSMAVDACHAECQANLFCNSYSTCLADDKVECVVSRLDLHNTKLIAAIREDLRVFKTQAKREGLSRGELQLASPLFMSQEGSGESAQEGEPFTLKLKVDRRCQMRPKRAIELFYHKPNSPFRIYEQDLKAVENVEQCAQLCMASNVDVFNQFKRQLTKLDDTDRLELLKRMTEASRSWCDNFRYVDLQTNSVTYALLDTVRRTKGLERAVGLCFIKNHTKEHDWVANSFKTKFEFSMEKFEFRYLSLFERQKDFRLLGSLDFDQFKSTTAQPAEGSEGSEPRVLPINDQFVLSGRNDPARCAQLCFSQALVLDCRSFDYITVLRNNRLEDFCVYNSMALDDLRRLGYEQATTSKSLLVEGGGDGQQAKVLNMWHYEPQPAYFLDRSALTALKQDSTGLPASEGTRSGGFQPVLVYLLGITSGLVVVALVRCSPFHDANRRIRERLEQASQSLGLSDVTASGQLVRNDELELENKGSTEHNGGV